MDDVRADPHDPMGEEFWTKTFADHKKRGGSFNLPNQNNININQSQSLSKGNIDSDYISAEKIG